MLPLVSFSLADDGVPRVELVEEHPRVRPPWFAQSVAALVCKVICIVWFCGSNVFILITGFPPGPQQHHAGEATWFRPCEISCFHRVLFSAVTTRDSVSMLHGFMSHLQTSLYCNWGCATPRDPDASSPYSRSLGIREYGHPSYEQDNMTEWDIGSWCGWPSLPVGHQVHHKCTLSQFNTHPDMILHVGKM